MSLGFLFYLIMPNKVFCNNVYCLWFLVCICTFSLLFFLLSLSEKLHLQRHFENQDQCFHTSKSCDWKLARLSLHLYAKILLQWASPLLVEIWGKEISRLGYHAASPSSCQEIKNMLDGYSEKGNRIALQGEIVNRSSVCQGTKLCSFSYVTW